LALSAECQLTGEQGSFYGEKKLKNRLPAFLTGAVDIYEDEDFSGCEIFERQYSRAFEWFDQGSSKHYQDVAYILCASYKLGLKSELDQVIARFSKDGSLASASILETVYLPFLVGLAKWIEKSKALNFPSFQKLYQNILSSFISQSVTLTQSTTRLDSKDSWVWLHEL
jgi:hypothetical protein